jgi:hypothetical protein
MKKQNKTKRMWLDWTDVGVVGCDHDGNNILDEVNAAIEKKYGETLREAMDNARREEEGQWRLYPYVDSQLPK